MFKRKDIIYYKTEEEIELLRQSALLVSSTLAEIAKHMKTGENTLKLDKIAEEFIKDNGAVPGFLNYKGFPNTLCVSVNDAVVHGIPTERPIEEGDVLSIDCGVILNGFYGDSAYSYRVGEVTPEVDKLMKVTHKCLYLGIEQAVETKRVGDISFAIQNHAERENGYGVVRELVGHGIGRNLHEKPEVPNYGKRGRGPKLKNGLVIAIEPMINMGKKDVIVDDDGWTIRAADGKPSAHFEHTVVVRKDKAEILSDFTRIEEAISKNVELSASY